MDKNQHIEIDEKELKRLMDGELNFDDIVGHKVNFNILGAKNIEDGSWLITAEAEFAMSLNGMDWASVTVPFVTTDNDYDSALATAMMGVAGGLNNPELLARIRYLLNQQKTDEGVIIKGERIM